jgi:hypothetical protein
VSRVPSTRVWEDRHALGADPSQTRAARAGIVAVEGGGFNPTLDSGGGAEVSPTSKRGRL